MLFSYGIVLTAVLRVKRLGIERLMHDSRNSLSATLGLLAVPLLLLVPGLGLCVLGLESVLQSIVPMSGREEQAFQRLAEDGYAGFFTICLLAPLLEEVLYRGVILRAFLHQYGRWQAICGSALLFGFAHLNIYQMLAGFLVGTVSGWLYERTRSLWPSLLFHGAYNGFLMFLAGSTIGADRWQPAPLWWAGSLMLAGLALVILKRLLGGPPGAA